MIHKRTDRAARLTRSAKLLKNMNYLKKTPSWPTEGAH